MFHCSAKLLNLFRIAQNVFSVFKVLRSFFKVIKVFIWWTDKAMPRRITCLAMLMYRSCILCILHRIIVAFRCVEEGRWNKQEWNAYITVSKRNYCTQKFRTARCLQHVNLKYIAIKLIFHQQNIAHGRKCVQYYSVRRAVIPFTDCDIEAAIGLGVCDYGIDKWHPWQNAPI